MSSAIRGTARRKHSENIHIVLCNPLIQFGEVFINKYRSGLYHDSYLISGLKTEVADPLGDDEGADEL